MKKAPFLIALLCSFSLTAQEFQPDSIAVKRHAINKINLSVRYGSKTLELAKGKNAIELGTQDELIETLALLQQVVIGGELDEAINNASEKLKAGFVK